MNDFGSVPALKAVTRSKSIKKPVAQTPRSYTMARFRVSRKNSVSKIFSRKTRIKQQAQSLLKAVENLEKSNREFRVGDTPGDTEGGYGGR